VKRYEGLFILNVAAKEDGVKETIDRISGEITTAGGKIETVQKMDKKAFSRVTDKKTQSGFYVNVIFQCGTESIRNLQTRFAHNQEVHRVLFTIAPEPKAEVK
jgi:ribosomal protein S6